MYTRILMGVVQGGASWRKKIKYFRVFFCVGKREEMDGTHIQATSLWLDVATCTAETDSHRAYEMRRDDARKKTIIFRTDKAWIERVRAVQRCPCLYIIIIIAATAVDLCFCLFYKVVSVRADGGYATKDENTLFPLSWKIIIFLCVNDSIRPLCLAILLSSLLLFYIVLRCVAIDCRQWENDWIVGNGNDKSRHVEKSILIYNCKIGHSLLSVCAIV